MSKSQSPLTDIRWLNRALGEIAPPVLAEEWDKLGMLIQPTEPKYPFRNFLLTIDLTDAVLDEAIRKRSQVIIAYHPPIFEPLARLGSFESQVQTRCVEAGICVYSPHTALDAVVGGVNDWLADGLGEGERVPIKDYKDFTRVGTTHHFKIVVFAPAEATDRIRSAMASQGAGVIGGYRECSFNLEGTGTFLGGPSTQPTVGKKGKLEKVPEVRIEMVCSEGDLRDAIKAIRGVHPYEEPAFDIYPLVGVPQPKYFGAGQGRRLYLKKPVSLETVIRRVKQHLGLKNVRVARSRDYPEALVHDIAVCAGAGGSLFKESESWLDGVDVMLTGEMRHHDILAANACGTTVILCDHTNTERGYLPVLKKKLLAKLGRGVRIDISKADREPLMIV